MQPQLPNSASASALSTPARHQGELARREQAARVDAAECARGVERRACADALARDGLERVGGARVGDRAQVGVALVEEHRLDVHDVPVGEEQPPLAPVGFTGLADDGEPAHLLVPRPRCRRDDLGW